MIRTERTLWLAAVCVAIAAGLYFRLTGFYIWPLSVDEFYIYRSMAFVLDTGLPQFPCGGFYTRGLLYQYLVVPLLYVGVSPEAALRAITIISNILMLPAAYLLSRNIAGPRIAAAVLIVLCLSTWEIEMSRFGRMYAPFQLLFMWYVYHAYLLIARREMDRWRWLIALSIIGPLVWEGAIVLALFNFVPILVERKCRYSKHYVSSALVFLATVVFLTTDFRSFGVEASSSTSVSATPATDVGLFESYLRSIMPVLADSPITLVIVSIFTVLLGVFIGRALMRSPLLGTEKIVLVISSVALIANQLLLAALILATAVHVNWFRLEALRNREVRNVVFILLALCVFYVSAAILGDYSPTLTSRVRALIAFPDILYAIIYPWLYVLPIMAITLVLMTLGASWYSLTSTDPVARGIRTLIAFILIGAAVIGAVPTLYHEIRYSFFLYPLVICVAGYGIAMITQHLGKRYRTALTVVPALFLLIFLASSDFAFDHLSKIDSHDANYRIGYDIHRARQYYPRMDFRGPAEYVNNHASPGDSVIVSSVVYSQYLDRPGSVYLDKTDGRYRGQVCANGLTERWTGWRLLDSVSDLSAAIGSGETRTTWIIVDQQISKTQRWANFMTRNPGGDEVYKSTDDRTSVYRYSAAD